jgi:hypothetical protein
MDQPIGIPSGWENAAAWWSKDYEVDCLMREIEDGGISAKKIADAVCIGAGDLFDWRVEA